MHMRRNYFILFSLFFCLFFYLFAFVVYETENAMVTQLGKIKTVKGKQGQEIVKIYYPGLNFKIPLIQESLKFDMRSNLLDVQSTRITTTEKKDVIVDFYIIWRINNLALYYTRTGGILSKGEHLLGQKVLAALKAEFGKKTIKEVVHGERLELMIKLKEITDESTKSMGVNIVDVRVKKIDLPYEVRNSVYLRMRAERERVASETRATANAEATKIRAVADKERRVILAETLFTVNSIKGSGDAEAALIYANAYSKNKEFYYFYRSISAYKEAFSSKDDLLILNPVGDFFRFFSKSF